MEYNRIERMVYEYLDSMVGDSPVLLRIKGIDPRWTEDFPIEMFYVNEVLVGSIRIENSELLIETKIRNTLMILFDLDMQESYSYFKGWIKKLEVKNGVVRIPSGPDSLRSR